MVAGRWFAVVVVGGDWRKRMGGARRSGGGRCSGRKRRIACLAVGAISGNIDVGLS